MAFVPVQLERFFEERLRKLGVINDVHHPRCMKALSGVVLSSTYCYHQLGTWKYRRCSRIRHAGAVEAMRAPSARAVSPFLAQNHSVMCSDVVGDVVHNGTCTSSGLLNTRLASGKSVGATLHSTPNGLGPSSPSSWSRSRLVCCIKL
jgi:hypothetical protein